MLTFVSIINERKSMEVVHNNTSKFGPKPWRHTGVKSSNSQVKEMYLIPIQLQTTEYLQYWRLLCVRPHLWNICRNCPVPQKETKLSDTNDNRCPFYRMLPLSNRNSVCIKKKLNFFKKKNMQGDQYNKPNNQSDQMSEPETLTNSRG